MTSVPATPLTPAFSLRRKRAQGPRGAKALRALFKAQQHLAAVELALREADMQVKDAL